MPLVLTSTQQTPVEVPGPRPDFIVLTEVLGGTLSYPPKSDNTLLGRIEKKTAADLRQAFAALKQRRYVSAYVSLSEKIAVPLALLLPRARARRPAHIVVVHHLTSVNKRKLQQRTGYLHRFDRIITLGETQKQYCIAEAGIPPARVAFVRDAVDARFWTPQPTVTARPDLVLSVGREQRDYETLAAALSELPDLRSVVVASSPWTRSGGEAPQGEAPPNMIFRKGLSYTTLRDLYSEASLIVVPVLKGTYYAAGANGCLEGMAMHKPVLVSATPGMAEYWQSGDAVAVVASVPAGDPSALAAGIRALCADPVRCESLAATGHRFVATTGNTDAYVAAVARVVREAEGDA